MDDFTYDVVQRKRLAGQARRRKCGSKSKKCNLSQDYMTTKQWKERCGNIMSYDLNSPMVWAEFKAMPEDIQREYITRLIDRYSANATNFSEMFGISPETFKKHLKDHNFGITFKVGHYMRSGQRAAWGEFVLDRHSKPKVEERQDTVCVNIEENGGDGEGIMWSLANMMSAPIPKTNSMRQFSFVFDGNIRVDDIANSIRGIVGSKEFNGKIEITCSM